MNAHQFISQLVGLTNQEKHKRGTKQFSFYVTSPRGLRINGEMYFDCAYRFNQRKCTDPDFILCRDKDLDWLHPVSILVVADYHPTSRNYFLDKRRLDATSHYIAFVFVKQRLIKLVPSKPLASWLLLNKDNRDKVTPYSCRSRNIDGYIVNRGFLSQEIPNILELSMG